MRSKNLNNPAKSGRPKTVDSEAELQEINVNPMSSTQRVSGKLSNSLLEFLLVTLLTLAKARATKLYGAFNFLYRHLKLL